jgi:site-specific DNA recombinase
MRQGLNYLRVSSRRQVDIGFDEDGLSLPAQREACARYAAEHGISIVGEYLERGESARTADRPAFQAMLARIQQERDVQVVVVHKVDRFAATSRTTSPSGPCFGVSGSSWSAWSSHSMTAPKAA